MLDVLILVFGCRTDAVHPSAILIALVQFDDDAIFLHQLSQP